MLYFRSYAVCSVCLGGCTDALCALEAVHQGVCWMLRMPQALRKLRMPQGHAGCSVCLRHFEAVLYAPVHPKTLQ
jgi:hypothetical protein